jgi:hypothetical protein
MPQCLLDESLAWETAVCSLDDPHPGRAAISRAVGSRAAALGLVGRHMILGSSA